MYLNTHTIFKNIVAFSIATMFFACTNNSNEVREFFTAKNLPIGVDINTNYVYKDSGRITSKMRTPKRNDFSNREHPYYEFPKGIELISFENQGKDSTTIKGNYCLTYLKTNISELTGNVIIINHTDNSKLTTSQLFWDQNTNYFFSEKEFTLISPENTLKGVGFESKKDLSKFLAKKMSGEIVAKEN